MARRAVIFAALVALGAPRASAQISEKKRELAKIQSELRRTQAELEQLRAAEDALGHDVDRLQGLDMDSRQRAQSLQETIRLAEIRRDELRARLAAAGSVGGFWSAALSAETARHAAAEAGRSDFYGTGELWAEEYRRLAIFEKARHLRGVLGFQRRIEEDEARARQKADALDRTGRRAQIERDLRRHEYEWKKSQLEKTQMRVAEATRHARELEDSAKAMTALVEMLARAAAQPPRPVPGGAVTLNVPRHSLPWPATGRVLSGFGREKDPELGTTIVRQGMTLATAASAPVAPVADGKVIFSGPFRSYGNVVIVDHGGGFFSIYGSLGQITTSKGAIARAGEPFARAGAAASGGGRLYLEIRRGTQALDPAAWLETNQY
jgi:septal ring factor EnvC (AmiA/AmiB activator)